VKSLLACWLALSAGAPLAPSFVLTLNDARVAQHWSLLAPDPAVSTNIVNPNTHAIRYFLAADGFSTTNTAAELDAVRAAFAQWQAIPGTHLKFEEAGLIEPVADVNSSDDTNTVYWSHSAYFLVNGDTYDITSTLGVAFVRSSDPDNTILEGDIVFNGVTRNWFTDFNDAANTNVFVESVATHEIGHFIGLSHSPVGGATMLFRGGQGVNVQAGLSSDEIAAARCLYPVSPANYGAVKGVVTKSGSPILGAAVFLEDAVSNVISGTVTLPDGTYEANMLAQGDYKVRVAPLDNFTSIRLCTGFDISHSTESTNTDFTSADAFFLPTTNVSITLTADTTNAVNFAVVDAAPSFRIRYIRAPTSNPGSYSWSQLPARMAVGQSNYTIGVASADLPTSGVSLTIGGNGLTLGPVSSNIGPVFAPTLRFWSVPISVASNATPGLRDFIVTHQGTNVAYANGFLEIQPGVYDYNFDGLNDLFQRQYFAPWTSASAAPGADPDGDGMTNSAEHAAGTIPTNAASLLKMLSVARTNSTATVRWSSVPGKRYQISMRTNLGSGGWSNVGSVVTAAGTNALYNDATATNVFRSYRVQVAP